MRVSRFRDSRLVGRMALFVEKRMKYDKQPALLHNAAPFVGLFVALVALFYLVLIGVYSHMWIPVSVGIAVYFSGVTWLFLKLRSDYVRICLKYDINEAKQFKEYVGAIPAKYDDDEAKQFKRRAKYFMAGNILKEYMATFRAKYDNDDVKRFNRRARYFMAGNGCVMLVMMTIFLRIRHAI